MALGVPNQSTGTGSVPSTQQLMTPAAGSWLMAVVGVTTNDNSGPSVCVGDYARNMWQLVYSGKNQAQSVNAPLFVQVWACPAVQYAGWPQLGTYVSLLYASATDTASFCTNVFEVTGMVNGYLTVDSVTLNTASAATTISVTTPAPSGSANCLMVSAIATDNTSATYNLTSGGWTALTVVTDTNPNVRIAPVWRESTATATATWTSSVAVNWAAAAVAIRVTGTAPSQPNPKFPALEFQLGLGYGLDTPINAVSWTPFANRLMQWDTQRGIQFELGQVQSSPTDMTIRNDDGLFTPKGVPADFGYTLAANGTTTTLLLANADAANVLVGDFFTIDDAAGNQTDLAVFQVTALSVGVTNTTVTFTRADGSGGGASSSTVINGTFSYARTDVYTPYRILASWNGVRYPVTCGWVERWPSQWDDPHWGVIQAVGVDVIATLTAQDVPSVQGEIMARGPAAYWPLNDPAGSSQAADQSGVGTVPLVVTTSTNGVGNSSSDFGVSTQAATDTGSLDQYGPGTAGSIIGDPGGTSWAVRGLTAADVTAGKGQALVGSPGDDVTFPSITNGVTICGVLYSTITDATANPGTGATTHNTLMILRKSTGTGAAATILKISIQPSGTWAHRPEVTVWDQTTHVSTLTAINTGDGFFSQFAFWAISFNRTNWTYYGSSGSSLTTTSGTCNLPAGFGLIDIGGEADSTANANLLNGAHAHIAIYPRRLTVGELGSIWDSMNLGQSPFFAINDTISHKLWYANWQGARVLNYTSYNVGSDIVVSSSVAEKVSTLAGYEGGSLFCDAVGQLQFRGVDRAALQTSRATLGDRPDLGEIPYVGDSSTLVVDYDSTYLYNKIVADNTGVVVSWNPAAGTQQISVSDDASIARYGERTLGVTTNLASSANVTTLIGNLLTKYSQPRLRVSTITIDVVTSQQWAFALSVEVGDVVTFKRRPIGAPNTITIVCVVLSVQHTVDPPDQWDLVLTLAPR